MKIGREMPWETSTLPEDLGLDAPAAVTKPRVVKEPVVGSRLAARAQRHAHLREQRDREQRERELRERELPPSEETMQISTARLPRSASPREHESERPLRPARRSMSSLMTSTQQPEFDFRPFKRVPQAESKATSPSRALSPSAAQNGSRLMRPRRRTLDGQTSESLFRPSSQVHLRSSPDLHQMRGEPCAEGRRGDPMGLRRFTEAQRLTFPRALREIRAGKKSSCWMWFVIPTPPHVVNGVERGSFLNRKYALRSDAEVKEYLEFRRDGVDLRINYLEIMQAVLEQLRAGKRAVSLLGHFDEPKLVSSVTCFQRVATELHDEELGAVLAEILELISAPT